MGSFSSKVSSRLLFFSSSEVRPHFNPKLICYMQVQHWMRTNEGRRKWDEDEKCSRGQRGSNACPPIMRESSAVPLGHTGVPLSFRWERGSTEMSMSCPTRYVPVHCTQVQTLLPITPWQTLNATFSFAPSMDGVKWNRTVTFHIH